MIQIIFFWHKSNKSTVIFYDMSGGCWIFKYLLILVLLIFVTILELYRKENKIFFNIFDKIILGCFLEINYDKKLFYTSLKIVPLKEICLFKKIFNVTNIYIKLNVIINLLYLNILDTNHTYFKFNFLSYNNIEPYIA